MLIIKLLLIIWGICSVGAFFQFVNDVRKWHDYEKKITITPSNFNDENTIETNESEVKDNERDSDAVSDAGQPDSSIVSCNWL